MTFGERLNRHRPEVSAPTRPDAAACGVDPKLSSPDSEQSLPGHSCSTTPSGATEALARASAHDRARHEGRDGYLDPVNGLFVMTEAFLRNRGTCCASGCRHCPYEPSP